jgi:hypothetical protein
MLRLAVLVVAVLMQLGWAGSTLAAEVLDVEAAGNRNLASIDMNDNGIPDEEEDCNLSATSGADGSNLMIKGTQESGNKARPCSEDGTCYGSGFVSNGFGEAIINSCDYASLPFVPLVADFCETLPSCLAASATSGQSAGQPSGPVNIAAGTILRLEQGFRAGSGQLCSAGGPAVEVTGDDGVTVLRNLYPYPSEENATHMCVDNVPVQVVMGGNSDPFVNKTVCFPVNDGVTPLAMSGQDPFAIIRFVDLAPCGAGTRPVPTASEWGLMALIATLLGFGAWTLGRRRGFAGLPLP